MKIIIKLVCIAIFTTGSLTAQSFVEKTKVTKIMVVKNEHGEDRLIKTVTKDEHLNLFDIKDSQKINQDILTTPIYVEKTILVDIDNNYDYDKTANITFLKDQNISDYYLTSKEIISDLDKNNFDEATIIFEDIEDHK